MKPLVYIIILVFNGKKWLSACLSSVCSSSYENFKVLVVDNASSDGSSDYILTNFSKIKVIKNIKNYGFAEGNNIGIRYAISQGADFVILLNQDTKVEPEWISELIKAAEGNEKIGILGPFQYDYEGTSIDQNFMKILNRNEKFNRDFGARQLNTLYEVSEVIGAAMMFTRKFIYKVGIFDPLFFCYGEDSDLCDRALCHGYKIVAAAKSKIFHLHALVTIDKKNLFYEPRVRGMLLYTLKRHNRNFLANIFSYIRLAGYLLKKINKKDMFKFISVQIWFFIHLPLIIYKRYNENKRACYLERPPA